MDIEQQLSAALAPRRPGPELRVAVMAQVSAGAQLAHGARRKPGRPILFGTILVVAAAAAMLAMHLMRTNASQPVAVTSPLTAPDSEPVAKVGAVSPPALQSPQEESAPAALPAVRPFTVRVLPLQNEARDTTSQQANASTYAAFLERLRAVPGLTLLESGPTANAPEVQAEYRITIRSDGLDAGEQFHGMMQVETIKPDGTNGSKLVSGYVGDVAPRCKSVPPGNVADVGSSVCADPQGVAADLVARLRTMVFPPDPSMRRQLQARLLNRSLDAHQRLRALSDLASLGRARFSDGAYGAAGIEALRDPAAVRGAIDLATNADPLLRAQVWATLQGVGSADLVQPLLTALSQDSDGEVRLAVLSTLVADFHDNPRVHAAFEAAAQLDARPLVRALAARTLGGLGGEAAWHDYMLASLNDTHRTAAERIEALFYQLDLPMTAAYGSGAHAAAPQSALRLLDHTAIQALAEALPKAAADSIVVQRAALRLVDDLGRIDDPAITDMLLASLDDASPWLDRGLATQALGALPSRRNDPRVRAALEKISANDPSQQLRQLAATSLQDEAAPSADPGAPQAAANGMAAPAAAAGRPPRLGVMLIEMASGPYVPKELVGKAVVRAVAPESVAQKAGLMEGDVLLEMNGTRISSPMETNKILETVPRGVDVDVQVYRLGQTLNLKARF